MTQQNTDNRTDNAAKEAPRCAVIILNWNGEALLRRYLPFVAANTGSCGTVIVADNGSTDGSLALLASDFPGV